MLFNSNSMRKHPHSTWYLCLFHSVVAFRKSNKIGFFIKVIPQKEEDADVTVSFKIRHDFRNLAGPIRPSEEGADTAAEAIWLTHHVELRLGPLASWTQVLRSPVLGSSN